MENDGASCGVLREIHATPLAVRGLLVELMACDALAGLPPPLREDAELVLAEVLNNIVEHAYGGVAGPIWVRAEGAGPRVAFEVIDTGRPMPDGRAPTGRLPAHPMAEGGWGWHLIRALARNLRYRRAAGRNILTFSIMETDAVPAG